MILYLYELSDDLLYYCLFFIKDINNILNFANTNVYFNKLLNNNFYWLWGNNKYSYNFWKLAYSRTIQLSKPFINIKQELIRIYVFQENLKKRNIPEWNEQDFYSYWQALEKNKNKFIN